MEKQSKLHALGIQHVFSIDEVMDAYMDGDIGETKKLTLSMEDKI